MEKGYSLIEMMVVVGITILLSATLLGYNRSTERQFFANRDRAVLVSVLNRAKTLSVKRLNILGSCAYGVRIDAQNKELIIFKDITTENVSSGVFACRNDEGEYTSNFAYDGANEKLEAIKLDTNVTITKDGGTTFDFFDITFIPPNPIATSSPIATAVLPVLIELRSAGMTSPLSVQVSDAGQIMAR